MEESSRRVDPNIRLFDIAANMSDNRFRGDYHGRKWHANDFDTVIQRARDYGVEKFLFSAGSLKEARISYDLSAKVPGAYVTICCHPTRANEVFRNNSTVEDYQQAIENIIEKHFKDPAKLVAIGECGLDYDRLNCADIDTQYEAFKLHFSLAEKYSLPMYLHSRSTGGDFVSVVKQHRDLFSTGVVHSFTGDEHELAELLELDLYIGVNGCSMKTQENCEVVKKIPLDKIMLETDCPYCDIRRTHHSPQFVKTDIPKVAVKNYDPAKLAKERNEPCTMVQVLEAAAALLEVSEGKLAAAAWENSLKMFGVSE